MTLPQRPGWQRLTDYQRHGSGIDLFRAYLERRWADKDKNETWRQEDVKRHQNGQGVPFAEFDAAFDQRLFLNILDALDPVIQELVKFCETPDEPDDQLPKIRSALRIGKGRAPSDADRMHQKWRVVSLWIAAYLAMQDGGEHKSETTLKREIAAEAGVSETTALNHWRELKESEPHQNRWATAISTQAEMRAARAKADDQNPAPKATAKRSKLLFGKGRANQ